MSSTETFALTGAVGHVDVLPANMRVNRPERRASRILPGVASQPIPDSAELFSGGSVRNSYHHREWIIRAGTPLYVLGEVARNGSRVSLRRPASGLHLISTRDVRQLIRRARVLMIAGSTVATAGLVLGVVLVIAAII